MTPISNGPWAGSKFCANSMASNSDHDTETRYQRPCCDSGYSHEWVRQRLVKAPEKLYKNGRRYKVPKGVAEEFVRSVFV